MDTMVEGVAPREDSGREAMTGLPHRTMRFGTAHVCDLIVGG